MKVSRPGGVRASHQLKAMQILEINSGSNWPLGYSYERRFIFREIDRDVYGFSGQRNVKPENQSLQKIF